MRRRLDRALLLIAAISLAACSNDDTGGVVGTDAGGGRSDGGATPREDATAEPDSVAEDVAVTPDARTNDVVTIELPSPGDTGSGACIPNASECVGTLSERVCNAEGTAFVSRDCDEGSYCFGTPPTCRPAVCRPSERECTDGVTYRECAVDGSGWLGANSCGTGFYCDDGRCLDATCLPNVLFALDGSGSMDGQWPNVIAAVNNAVAAQPLVAFGLAMFPRTSGCAIADDPRPDGRLPGPWPDVPIQANSSRAIARWFDTNPLANGNTPLLDTLEWLAEHAEEVWGAAITNGYLVVLSDGEDTCNSCPEGDSACVARQLEDATQALVAKGVRVYIIGYNFSGASEQLRAVARAGGTDLTDFIRAGNEETLIGAFTAIFDDLKGCD